MRAVPLASRCVSSASTPPAYPARMVVSVRLFAGLRERAGSERIEVELPDGASVADLLAAMGDTPVGPLRPGQCVVEGNREHAPAAPPAIAPSRSPASPPPPARRSTPPTRWR